MCDNDNDPENDFDPDPESDPESLAILVPGRETDIGGDSVRICHLVVCDPATPAAIRKPESY